MRSVYLIADIIIALGLLYLAGISLIKGGYKNIVNKIFALFSFFTAVWIISNNISNNVNLSSNIALFANYIVFSSSFAVMALLMAFIVKLANAKKVLVIIKKSSIFLLILCAMSATPLVVSNVNTQDNVYAVNFGPLIWLYGLALFVMAGVTVYALIYGIRILKGIAKRRIKAISMGLVVALPLVFILSFIIPSLTGNFEVTEFGITPVLILVFCLYYSVARYQLFDIKRAIIRTSAYILSLISLSAIYYGLAYLLSIFIFKDKVTSSLSVSPVNIALALVLAFVFQPIKKFFDRYTDKIFYKDGYKSDEFFTRLNKTLGSTIDLRGLLERASVEIGKTLKAEQAFFFIHTEDGHYVTAGTPKHKLLPKADADELEKAMKSKTGVVVASLLEKSDPIKRLLNSYRVELAMPLLKDSNIIGYFFLGEHLTSHYTNKDLKVLNATSNGLIIAIQNALAVQKIREFNETLQQKVANATEELRESNKMLRQLDKAKDEFVGMASHQLRTPLTSIKGYISMVIDGDAGKITNSQKQLLDEAFNSSERMVSLINDFLNVSRIQTGKFILEKNQLNLANLVEQEINNLQPNATAHNLVFNFIKPDNFPITIADEGKIRQVVMNFLDNAIYYSPDNTIVNVDVRSDNDEVIFTVKDNGIGVPVHEKSQLFTKFYRASNARRKRPDGTGVGLYLAKKIITDHEGDMIFESIEGKGSTFGFRLPIK